MLFRYLIRHKDKYPLFSAKQTSAKNKVSLGGEAFFRPVLSRPITSDSWWKLRNAYGRRGRWHAIQRAR